MNMIVGEAIELSQLKFHSSWEWLIPVVHKILREWMPETGTWPWEYYKLQKMGLGSLIDSVHKNVIVFIKWYNQQPKSV